MIPTEPIGSIPRPAQLIEARSARQTWLMSRDRFREIRARVAGTALAARELVGA